MYLASAVFWSDSIMIESWDSPDFESGIDGAHVWLLELSSMTDKFRAWEGTTCYFSRLSEQYWSFLEDSRFVSSPHQNCRSLVLEFVSTTISAKVLNTSRADIHVLWWGLSSTFKPFKKSGLYCADTGGVWRGTEPLMPGGGCTSVRSTVASSLSQLMCVVIRSVFHGRDGSGNPPWRK